MPFLAPLIPAAIGAAAQIGAAALGPKGGNTKKASFTPISSSALNISRKKGRIIADLGRGFEAELDRFRTLAGTKSADVGALRGELRGGAFDLRQAQLAQLAEAEELTIGDLRASAARRRLLGSSFEQDAVARVRNQFAKTRAELEAKSILETIDADLALINNQYQSAFAAIEKAISAQEFLGNAAVQLSTNTSTNLSAAARQENELAAQAATGLGKFVGDLGIDQIASKALNSIFGTTAFTG